MCVKRGSFDIAKDVIVAIFCAYVIYWGIQNAGPNFTLSIDDPICPFSMSGSDKRTLTIANTNPFNGYEGKIGLIALERGQSRLPKGVEVKLYDESSEPIIDLTNLKSIKKTIHISIDEYVEQRSYLIDIIAFGVDGNEDKCSLYLDIESINLNNKK